MFLSDAFEKKWKQSKIVGACPFLQLEILVSEKLGIANGNQSATVNRLAEDERSIQSFQKYGRVCREGHEGTVIVLHSASDDIDVA